MTRGVHGRVLFALLVATSVFNNSCVPRTPPAHVYLTWQQDQTSRSMTVNFHSSYWRTEIYVHYDTAPRGGTELADYASRIRGRESRAMETIQRRIHWINLPDLEPDTTYYFVVSDGKKALTAETSFRTLPEGDATIRFVSGGDMDVSEHVATLHRQAAKLDPMFALIGGDIAYDNGIITNFEKWDQWLFLWTENMRTSDGRAIPMVLAIGNHEVLGGFFGDLKRAPFYSNYFAQEPDSSYFSRRFGNHTTLFVLDTGHAAYPGLGQKAWLKRELKRHQAAANRIALYHVPLYPSVRDYDGVASKLARKYWLPLFDRYRLTAAFENHDHALKRTYPLRGGKRVDEGQGTLYFGDGCWGKKTRPTDASRWYLAHHESTRHFWSVEADAQGMRLQAIDEDGAVKDSYTLRKD